MTKEEAYIRGKVVGYAAVWICKKNKHQREPDLMIACMRPKSAMTQILQKAFLAHLPQIFHDTVGEMICEIDFADIDENVSEEVQPLEIQSSFQLGYFAGKKMAWQSEVDESK